MSDGTGQKSGVGDGEGGRGGIKERKKPLSFLCRTDIGLLD